VTSSDNSEVANNLDYKPSECASDSERSSTETKVEFVDTEDHLPSNIESNAIHDKHIDFKNTRTKRIIPSSPTEYQEKVIQVRKP